MPPPIHVSPMSQEEFVEWEKTQGEKHEYFAGEVFAMSGGTTAHARITGNVLAMLLRHTENGPCEPYASDLKVKLSAVRAFYYPDVFVTCDERDRSNTQFQEFPRLIVEVLSPSTAAFDQGLKFQHYRTLASLEEYVLIDSEHRRVDCFRRREGGEWILHSYQPGDEVRLESLGFACPMESIYKGVRFSPTSRAG